MAARFSDVFFGILLTVMAVSCTTVSQDSASTSSLRHAVVTPVEVEDSDPVLYASLLDHPYAFELGTLGALLRSLYFSRLERQNWKTPKRPIFPEKTAGEVAPLMRKAFREAKPYQKIRFRIETEKGATTGDTFILEGALHWRFQLIEDTPQFEEFYNVAEFTGEASYPTNWVLITQEGQRYYSNKLTPRLLAKKYWVAMDLPPSTERQSATVERDLMARLQLLQELKDEGLISEEDYQRKVGSLVDVKSATDADPKDRLRLLKELREKELISEDEYEKQVQEVLEHHL